MAKNKVEIDVNVDDKGTTKKVALGAKKVGDQVDKTTKSTDRFQRGLKGVGEQSANASKNFAKFSQGMGGFVAVYATLAAQIFAISAAFNFLKSAGELKSLEAGQVAYAGATGIAMRTLARDIQQATNAQVGFRDAAQAGAIGTAAGLSADQLTRLGAAAKDASQILGRDVTDSFNRLVRGVTKAEPELLDELGIILRLKDASEKYATAIGKNADDLTQFEKSQAVANDVLTQAEQKYGNILKIVGDSPNEFSQLSTEFEELLNSVQKVAAAIAGPFVSVLKDAPAAGIAAFGLFLSGPLKAIGSQFGDMGGTIRKFANEQKAAFEEAKKASDKAALSYDNQKKKLDNLAKAQVGRSEGSAESKILQKLKAGEALGGADKFQLRKALKAAEKQLEDSSEVRVGIFEKANREILNDWKRTLDNMDRELDSTLDEQELALMEKQQRRSSLYASTAEGVLAVGRAMTKALMIVGRVAAAFVILRTALEFIVKTDWFADNFGRELTKTEIAARKAAEEMDYFKERMVDLSEQYKHLTKIQKEVRKEYDELGKATISVDNTLYASAKALTEFFNTTFSQANIANIVKNLEGVRVELGTIAEGQQIEGNISKGYEAALKLVTGIGLVFNQTKLLLGLLKRDNEAFSKPFELAADLATEASIGVYNSLADIEELDLNKVVTDLDDGTKAILANIETGSEAFQDFIKDLNKAGVSGAGYTVFGEVADALALATAAQKTLQKAIDSKDQEAQNEALNEFIKQMNRAAAAGPEMDKLSRALLSVQKAAEATEQSFTAFTDSILKVSTVQKSIRDLKTELDAIDALRATRTVDPEDVEEENKRYNMLQRRLAIAEDFNTFEVNHKKEMLRLQGKEQRNYERILDGTEKQLKKQDQIAKLEQERSFTVRQIATAEALSLEKHNRITPEVELQTSLMRAQVGLQNRKLALLREEAIIQSMITAEQNQLEQNKLEQEILRNVQEIAKFEAKTNRLVQDRLNSLLQISKIQSDSKIADIEGSLVRPERFKKEDVAQERLNLALQEVAMMNGASEKQLQDKIQAINLEYGLLDLQRKARVAEMTILKTRVALMEGINDNTKATMIQGLDALIGELGKSTEEQRNAAIAAAIAGTNATREGYYKAVEDAIRQLEAAGTFQQMGKFVADSFSSSLTDAIDTAFTSLYDKTVDLGDALRDIGRSFLSTIQKRVTEMFIVDPIMESLSKLFKKDEGLTLADKTKAAIAAAINDPTNGIAPQARNGLDAGALVVKDAIILGSKEGAQAFINATRDAAKVALDKVEEVAPVTKPPVVEKVAPVTAPVAVSETKPIVLTKAEEAYESAIIPTKQVYGENSEARDSARKMAYSMALDGVIDEIDRVTLGYMDELMRNTVLQEAERLGARTDTGNVKYEQTGPGTVPSEEPLIFRDLATSTKEVATAIDNTAKSVTTAIDNTAKTVTTAVDSTAKTVTTAVDSTAQTVATAVNEQPTTSAIEAPIALDATTKTELITAITTSADKIVTGLGAIDLCKCMPKGPSAAGGVTAPEVGPGTNLAAESATAENATIKAATDVNTGMKKTMTKEGGGFISGVGDAFERGGKYIQNSWNEMSTGMKTIFATGVASITAAMINGGDSRSLKTAFLTTLVSAGMNALVGARSGGIIDPPKYGEGGIATGSKRGHLAELHGTEAVVPLPNGNAIPVEMKGGNTQQNNVTVNVSVDSSGQGKSSTQQSDGPMAGDLGNLIAGAVQKELQNQKRSGGVLNPYGSS